MSIAATTTPPAAAGIAASITSMAAGLWLWLGSRGVQDFF